MHRDESSASQIAGDTDGGGPTSPIEASIDTDGSVVSGAPAIGLTVETPFAPPLAAGSLDAGKRNSRRRRSRSSRRSPEQTRRSKLLERMSDPAVTVEAAMEQCQVSLTELLGWLGNAAYCKRVESVSARLGVAGRLEMARNRLMAATILGQRVRDHAAEFRPADLLRMLGRETSQVVRPERSVADSTAEPGPRPTPEVAAAEERLREEVS